MDFCSDRFVCTEMLVVSMNCEVIHDGKRATLEAWSSGVLDIAWRLEAVRNSHGNLVMQAKDGSSPLLMIHYAGLLHRWKSSAFGRRLLAPLNICVLQGLSFVKACLLAMAIPAHVGDNSPNVAQTDGGLIEGVDCSESKNDELVKIDPYGRNWGLRFLELELSNLTGVVFEIRVPIQLESCNDKNTDLVDGAITEYDYPKT